MYHYALYLTKDQETARDLCQEVFIRWFNLENPREVKVPGAWLKKVISNLAANYFRRQKLRSRIEVSCDPQLIEGQVSMEKDLTRIEVEEVLSRLPWKEQLLLKMRMSGLSYADMAESLDIAIGSVGTMLARAMKKFKYEYEEKEAGKDELSGGMHDSSLSGRRNGF